jgi:mediator of RNA polymerase II transcription subunit 14
VVASNVCTSFLPFFLIMLIDDCRNKLATGLSVITHCQIPMRLTSLNPTHTFLTALHLFAAAMISQYSNMRALHSRKAMYKAQSLPSTSVTLPMKLPGILIKLSDLLQPTKSAVRSGQPWAKSTLRLSFQGLRMAPTSSPLPSNSVDSQEKPKDVLDLPDSGTQHDKPESAVENAIIIAQASIGQPMPSSLDLVKQRVDKDIAFHPTSGAFAFRLQSKVGESSIPELMERLNHVEQLVQFIAVAKKHEKTLHCENISLGRVNLSYGGHTSQSSHSNSTQTDAIQPSYRASIDFAGKDNEMKLTLHSGNPHIRVLDHLIKILNSSVGLDGFATYVPLTLPLLRAFDALEKGWGLQYEHGHALVFSRAIDWYTIRYTLNPQRSFEATELIPQLNTVTRNVDFEVKLQHRGRQPWWWVRRNHERNTASAGGDEIDTALVKVWNDNPEGENNWRGMQNAAIARDSGVELLIEMVDRVMRDIALNPPTPLDGPVTQTTARQSSPVAAAAQANNQGHKQNQTQAQQQRQITSQQQAQKPSQSQARSQQQQHVGRNGQKHEMIVID